MYYIGVDLGGTNIAVGIVNEKLEILKKSSIPTNANRNPDLIVKDMADLAARLLSELKIPLSEVLYAGIATPGTANRDTGIVEYANNLPFLQFPLADTFRKYLPVPRVLIENDANAAALAEALVGVAKDTRYSVMITLGTGIGGGIVIDNKIYSGFNYAGAELGHTVIEYNGRPCSCGRRGCFEAYGSATGLSNLTRDKIQYCKTLGIPTQMLAESENGTRVNARTAFSAMKKGDIPAKEVVDEYISYLAAGITNMINIFQPEVLSIGGGVCNEKDYLLKPLMKIVDREQYTRNGTKKTKILIAKLGNDAGIIGAAGLDIK